MKILYQALIIIFVGMSVFVVRNDVKLAYNHASSFVKHFMGEKPHSASDVVTNEADTRTTVQYFGLPRGECPTTDEVLHKSILILEKQITDMEGDLTLRRNKINRGALYEGKTTDEQVSEYNSLVRTYNSLVKNLQEKITTYNSGVRALKTCLEVTTQSTPTKH